MSIFSEALKKAVKERRVNISQLARDCNLSRQHIHRIINGEQNTTLATAEEIGKHIGLRVTFEAINGNGNSRRRKQRTT